MNKNTYELLSLAAKAANYTNILGIYYAKLENVFYSLDGPWNPITNNEDAFTLAVALQLEIRPNADTITIAGNGVWEEITILENDRIKTTRQAITQAAASIAKKLP